MPNMPSLWNGYDEEGEDGLLALLDRRVDAALDADDPSADERSTRDLAQAIESHEWLKREHASERYYARLHARAREVRAGDVGSWRRR